MRFTQSKRIAPQFELCTWMRVKACNEFKRQFWKFLVNSNFGKYMEKYRTIKKDQIIIRTIWSFLSGKKQLNLINLFT